MAERVSSSINLAEFVRHAITFPFLPAIPRLPIAHLFRRLLPLPNRPLAGWIWHPRNTVELVGIGCYHDRRREFD